jgi:intein-encoded DNA endonuclease-like protein
VRKLPINKKFFSSWNSEMAYILGFITADGCLGVKKIRKDKSKQYFLDITSKDFSLLRKIKKIMGANQKIGIKYGRTKKEKCYRIQIGYQEICKDLLKLGIQPKKTSTLNWINVPEKYFPDFVRGFFDGDGSVYIYEVNGTPQIKATHSQHQLSFY